MNEEHRCEADSSDEKADNICSLDFPELRDHESPEDRTHRLEGEEDADPVSCSLVSLRLHVSGTPDGIGDCAVGICPHIKEGRPADAPHEAHGPERPRSLLQKGEHARSLLLLLIHVYSMELRIFLRRHLLHLECSEEDTKDQDNRTDVERVLYGIRNLSFRSGVGNSEPCEEEREDESYESSGIHEEALDRISLALLLLADHVADKHLERLHSHVDRSVKKHQGDESEDHRTGKGEAEVAGVRKQAHHSDCDKGAEEKVRDTASETAPCPVAVLSYERLDDHTHEGRKNPEKAQTVRVCSQSRKDAAYIGTLEGICYLDSEESEADIPQLPESKFRFLHFIVFLVIVFNVIASLRK